MNVLFYKSAFVVLEILKHSVLALSKYSSVITRVKPKIQYTQYINAQRKTESSALEEKIIKVSDLEFYL